MYTVFCVRTIFVFNVLLMLITGCSTQPVPVKSTINAAVKNQLNEIVSNKQDVGNIAAISEQQLFSLSDEQKEIFLHYLHDHQQHGLPTHQIVANYISDKMSNFTYYGETYLASKVMSENKGNCMSLAIFTTALAKLAGVDISYRKVKTPPIFKKQNNILLSSTHVQAILYDPSFMPDEDKVYFSRPGIVIDYFPSSDNIASTKIDYRQFVSMYYQNIAADALISDNLNKALVYSLKGFEFDQSSDTLINTLAVLYRRRGDVETSAKLYQLGLTLDKESLSLLNNYIILLKSADKLDEAALMAEQLDKLDDPNPYAWLEQAYVSHKNHQFKKAIFYYQKTLENAPYVSEAYLGLYQIYLIKHQPQNAMRMLKLALEWTHEFEQRKQYKMKLYQLRTS